MDFRISNDPIDGEALQRSLHDPAAGAQVCFQGCVRNHHEGRAVDALQYEAYAQLAENEGRTILEEALNKFEIRKAACVHREGPLEIGDVAVWVGVSSAHRKAAFEACEFILNEVKARVPIWKKERYVDGSSEWIRCDHLEKQAG